MDNGVTDRIKEKFIIIYDEFTRPMALSLRNSITNESCVVWTEKVYNDNEFKLTNHNFLILLNEEMIKTHLANPAIKPISFSEHVILKHEGNTLGLKFDPCSYSYLSASSADNIDVEALVEKINATINADTVAKDKKQKEISLFKAIDKLKEGTLEKFLRGEELD